MRYPNIEAERARVGMTKKQLSDLLEISTSTLKNWQSGKTEIPASKIIRLARLFGTTADYLLGRAANDDHPRADVPGREASEKI